MDKFIHNSLSTPWPRGKGKEWPAKFGRKKRGGREKKKHIHCIRPLSAGRKELCPFKGRGRKKIVPPWKGEKVILVRLWKKGGEKGENFLLFF